MTTQTLSVRPAAVSPVKSYSVMQPSPVVVTQVGDHELQYQPTNLNTQQLLVMLVIRKCCFLSVWMDIGQLVVLLAIFRPRIMWCSRVRWCSISHRVVLVESFEWSMIMTSHHDLIAIAMSVPLVNKIITSTTARLLLFHHSLVV